MISDYLRARLLELDLSYAGFADELRNRGYEVTKGAVQHWVKGTNAPPLEDLRFRAIFAVVLETDANSLMVKLGYCLEDSQRSSEALRAADLMDLLPDDVKGLALEQLDALVRRYAKPPDS